MSDKCTKVLSVRPFVTVHGHMSSDKICNLGGSRTFKRDYGKRLNALDEGSVGFAKSGDLSCGFWTSQWRPLRAVGCERRPGDETEKAACRRPGAKTVMREVDILGQSRESVKCERVVHEKMADCFLFSGSVSGILSSAQHLQGTAGRTTVGPRDASSRNRGSGKGKAE